MDESVIKFYRKLLRTNFEHAGELEHPTIFLDSVGEKIQICSQSGTNYIHLYINIKDGRIENARYLCICDPTSNVAVEILCTLITGKSIEDIGKLGEEDFFTLLGSPSEELGKKARGLLELVNKGVKRYLDGSGLQSEGAI